MLLWKSLFKNIMIDEKTIEIKLQMMRNRNVDEVLVHAIALMFQSGCRVSSILNLSPADITANGLQLRLIQATDNRADHGGHNPIRTGYSQVRRLLHHETHLGELKWFEEIVVQAGVR